MSLMLYRRRQLWATNIVEKRLDRSCGQGLVPDLSEWEYWCHGVGCQLKHRITGEIIETETHDVIDVYFWLDHLQSFQDPDPVTRQMLEMHPARHSLIVTLADLRDAGVIRSGDRNGIHRFIIAEPALQHVDLIEQVRELMTIPASQAHIRGVIGDPDGAIHRERRLVSVRARLNSEGYGHDCVFALTDLGTPTKELSDLLLACPVSSRNVAAMDVVIEQDSTEWCDDVARLFRNVCPSGPVPEPELWRMCASYLLRHGYQVEQVLAALPLAGPSIRGEAAILGLEHAPDLNLAKKLLLAALTGESLVGDRATAAATLVLLDCAWAYGLLIDTLGQSAEWMNTAEIREALRECRGAGLIDNGEHLIT